MPAQPAAAATPASLPQGADLRARRPQSIAVDGEHPPIMSLQKWIPKGFRSRRRTGFGYRFTSAGHSHDPLIHDWEVQEAYRQYKRRYGDAALDHLTRMYGETIPARNLHLVMGTMLAHPRTFIIIGLLRSGFDPQELAKQRSLF